MPHETVIDPADPLVERVRAICMAYPEAAEVLAWGRPTFRAGKKIFVMMASSMDRPYSIDFKPDADERRALLQGPASSARPTGDRVGGSGSTSTPPRPTGPRSRN